MLVSFSGGVYMILTFSSTGFLSLPLSVFSPFLLNFAGRFISFVVVVLIILVWDVLFIVFSTLESFASTGATEQT